MVYACVELRAWVAELEKLLAGNQASQPLQTHQKDHYTQWLKIEHSLPLTYKPILNQIDDLYRQLDSLVITYPEENANNEVCGGLNAIYAVKNSLLEQLKLLLMTLSLEEQSDI